MPRAWKYRHWIAVAVGRRVREPRRGFGRGHVRRMVQFAEATPISDCRRTAATMGPALQAPPAKGAAQAA